MQIASHQAHLWSFQLHALPEISTAVLSEDELQRAERLLYPHHREIFLKTRCQLRVILSLYLNVQPQEIVFNYTEHKKPYIKNTNIQFNVSHSGDRVLYGISQYPIGVDIEKVETHYKEAVAKRFFSEEEYASLQADTNPTLAFYRIWARKESLIKASGKGFAIPFSSFTVPLQVEPALVVLEGQRWKLIPLASYKDYEAALSLHPSVTELEMWNIFNHAVQKEQSYRV